MPTFMRKPEIVEAEQILPGQPLPAGVHLWPDEQGCTPRDLSDGYLDTPEGRVHIGWYDWRIVTGDGAYYRCADKVFRATYTPLAGEAGAESEPALTL